MNYYMIKNGATYERREPLECMHVGRLIRFVMIYLEKEHAIKLEGHDHFSRSML